MDNIDLPRPAQEEVQPTKPIFTEVTTAEELRGLLSTRNAHEQTLASERVQGNLSKLVERTKEAEKKLFVMDLGEGQWAVVANSEQDAQQVQGKLTELSKLQDTVDAEKLWGMCIYIHEFASGLGISNGNFSATSRKGNLEDSVYQIRGIHDIGYVDLPDQKKSVYFDLTSKPYFFTDGSANDAVMQGIVIIEELGKSGAVESLYQNNWRREPFQPDQPLSQHVIQTGKDKFLKQK